METLGERLRALRMARRLTQAAAGQAAHISDTQLCAVERGSVPSPELLARLAAFYDTTVPDLLRGVDTPRPVDANCAALTALRRDHGSKSRLRTSKPHYAGDHRSGEVHGDYVDPERIAAWHRGLDRLAVPEDMREHAMAVVLRGAWSRDLEPLAVLERLADQHVSIAHAVATQARKR